MPHPSDPSADDMNKSFIGRKGATFHSTENRLRFDFQEFTLGCLEI